MIPFPMTIAILGYVLHYILYQLKHWVPFKCLIFCLFVFFLQISYDLTKLIHFMSHSPHGSIVMNDFRHQQFVLVKGQLKLSDIDDIGIGEPQCNSLNDCAVHSASASPEFTAKWVIIY